MKKTTLLALNVFLLLTVFILLPQGADAKSYTWNQEINGQILGGIYNPVCTITDPQIGITYAVTVTDANGSPIGDGATVMQGSTVYLNFTPESSSQIYWFGSGDCVSGVVAPGNFNPGSIYINMQEDGADSPYGSWVQNTSEPAIACSDSNDFVTSNVDDKTDVQSFYTDLEVTPTSDSITNTNGLSCGPLVNGTEQCTVTASTGAIVPSFNFSATQGSFWGRFESASNSTNYTPNECYPLYSLQQSGSSYTAVDAPMSFIDGTTGAATQSYVMTVPAESINYTLNVTPKTTPPAAPTLSCPSSLVAGQAGTFSVSGTDTTGYQLRYGMDWTNSQTVSQWLPSSGYVNSGTNESTTYTWSSPGTYTVNALSQDVNGNNSSWGSCQVTVTAQPDLTASLIQPTINATTGQTVNLSATIANIGGGSTGVPFATTFWTNTTQSWTGANAQYTEFTSGVPNGFPGNYSETDGPQLPVTRVFNTPGTYYYQVCADRDQSGNQTVSQSNPNNDCSAWGTITVTSPPEPDITSTVAPTPSTATVNSPQTFTGTNAISNIGNATATNEPNVLEVADSSDNLITYISAGNLTLGTSASGTVTAPYTFTSSGTYNVRWCGNMNTGGTNVITESNYGNNCGPWDTVTASVNTPAATISANPTTVNQGSPSTLTYECTNSTSGSISGVGSITADGNQHTTSVTPSSSTTYTLTCTGPGGTGSASVNVTVNVPTNPDITSTVAPTPSTATVNSPQTFTGTNAISNIGNATATNEPNVLEIANSSDSLIGYVSAGSLTLIASASGSVSASYTFAASGTYNVRWCGNMNTGGTNVITESNYGNNCGPWDTVTASAVTPAPTASLSANPTSITNGNSSTLTWSSTNANSCTGTNFSTGGAVSGTLSVSPSTTTTYSVTCTGTGGTSSPASATVTVTYSAPSVTCSVVPSSATTNSNVVWTAYPTGGNGTYTYSWSGTNVTGNTTKSVTTSYNTAGTYSASVNVTSNGQSTGSVACTTTSNGGGTVVISNPAGPDVTSTVAPTPSTATVNSPQTFTGTNAISNIGNATASNFPVVLEEADSNDNLIRYLSPATGTPMTLAQNTSGSISIDLEFAAAGTYNLRWCGNMNTSGTNVITESNYGNNCGPWDTVTAAADYIDLTAIAAPTPSTATTNVTQTFTGTNAIENIGNEGSGDFPNVLEVADGSDNPITYAAATPYDLSLAPNSPATVTSSYKFTSPGTYNVRWCANMTTAGQIDTYIPESNTNNNCSSWTTVTVTNGAGTSASCVPSPTAANTGSTITWTPTISGFSGTISYAWSDSNGTPTSGSASTFANSYASAGSYSPTLSVTDSNRDSARASCVPVTITNTPQQQGSCTATAQGDIVASPTRVGTSNTGVTLSYGAVGIPQGDTCTITGPNISPVTTGPADSSCTIATSTTNTTAITTQSTYTMTCTNWTGTAKTVVNIAPGFQEF